MSDLIDRTPIGVLLVAILLSLVFAALAGGLVRRIVGHGKAPGRQDQEAYIVSGMLGLLALLMGFTLSLSLDRFETRRILVLTEANAIGTAYLRTQLLPEPHRGRISGLLIDYLDNRLRFGDAPMDERPDLIKHDDALLVDMWAATASAFDDIKALPFSGDYLNAMNEVIDLDESRRTAVLARVPAEVFGLLFVFTLATSAILGFVLEGKRRQVAAGVLLLLLTMSLVLMLDIDGPSLELVKEPQKPLEDLRWSITSQPSNVYDKWREAK